MGTISWNPDVKLIISDVDETIADNYAPAAPDMIQALAKLLHDGKVLMMVSGASLSRICIRIVDALPPSLRRQIIIAHCSGVEVWGFSMDGTIRENPYYSLYEGVLTEDQKKKWREIIAQLIEEFKLKTYEPMLEREFKKLTNNDPLSIMVEDRGPQITFEVLNGYDLTPEKEKELEISVPQTQGAYDLRIPILERAEWLFAEANLPITPRLGGMWAIDFAIKGVNKTTAVKYVLENEEILKAFNLRKEDIADPTKIEIWGDKFSVLTGTDRHMSEAVSPQVRSIDFRDEDPRVFPEGYNIVVWDGEQHLHHGLLEYLQSR